MSNISIRREMSMIGIIALILYCVFLWQLIRIYDNAYKKEWYNNLNRKINRVKRSLRMNKRDQANSASVSGWSLDNK